MSGIVPEVPAIVWGILFVCINTFVNVRGIELTAFVNRITVVCRAYTFFVMNRLGCVHRHKLYATV